MNIANKINRFILAYSTRKRCFNVIPCLNSYVPRNEVDAYITSLLEQHGAEHIVRVGSKGVKGCAQRDIHEYLKDPKRDIQKLLNDSLAADKTIVQLAA